MKCASKLLGTFMLGASLALAPHVAKAQSQNSQPSYVKVNANYGKAEKSIYAAYWENNPRVRFGYLNPGNFSLGAYIPLLKSDLKAYPNRPVDLQVIIPHTKCSIAM